MSQNGNVHARRGFIPAQRSLKYFDQQLNSKAVELAQKELERKAAANVAQSPSKTLLGKTAKQIE